MEISINIPGLEMNREYFEILGASKPGKYETDVLFRKTITMVFPSILRARERGYGWGRILEVIQKHTGADINELSLVRENDLLSTFIRYEPQEQAKLNRKRKIKEQSTEPGTNQISLKSIRIEDTNSLGEGDSKLHIPGDRQQ